MTGSRDGATGGGSSGRSPRRRAAGPSPGAASRWRLAARLARRDVRRRPGRTALVALLVALPVAGMLVATVLLATDHLSVDEQWYWQRSNGDADAVVHGGPSGLAPDVAGLPQGSRVVETTHALSNVATTDGRRDQISVTGSTALDDPLVSGLWDLTAGRLPSAGGEVALSPGAADTLGVAAGDRLELERPDLDVEVVGIVENRTDLSLRAAVVTDARPYAWGREIVMAEALVDLPDGADAAAIAAANPDVEVRGHPDPALDVSGVDERARRQLLGRLSWTYVVGAVVLTVVGIVIAAAFAAGARRQLTTLGQLSANGASVAVMRAMLILQGTVTGLVGALAGLALAAAVLAAGRGRIEVLFNRRLPSYDLRPAHLAVACLIGVVAATLAAVVPARTVTRVPTLTALAGRRPLPPVRRRVVAGGVAAVATGVVLLGIAVLGSAGVTSGGETQLWTLVAMAGGVLELLGVCAVAPAVVAYLEPLAGRSRGAWRLAARSLARQRSRTGAVVSAVAAAGGLAVAAASIVSGLAADDGAERRWPDDVVLTSVVDTSPGLAAHAAAPGPATLAELDRILPAAEATPVRLAGRQADWADSAVPVVADEAVLDALDAGQDVRRLLAEAGVVRFGPARAGVEDVGTATGGPAAGPGDAEITLPDGSVHELAQVQGDTIFTVVDGFSTFIDPALAADLGVDQREAAVVYRTPEPLTPRQSDDLDWLRTAWYDLQPVDGASHLWVSADWNEPDGPTPAQIEMILATVALVFSVLVVGASLALAAAESRDERDVLVVAGVAPGRLARTSGAKAWLLAVTGTALAVPAGLLPVAVAVRADDGVLPFVMPWPTIGLLALGLPLVAAVVALVGTAVAQRIRPVTISTARFE